MFFDSQAKDLAFLVRSTAQRRLITRGDVVLRLWGFGSCCSEVGSICVSFPPNRELPEPFGRLGHPCPHHLHPWISCYIGWFACLHYWNAPLCRLPKAVGKGPKTGGKGFVDCFLRDSRQRTRRKEFIDKETFAACPEESCGQSLYHMSTWQSAKETYAVVRWRSAFRLPTATQQSAKAFLNFFITKFLCQLSWWAGGKGCFNFFKTEILCRLPLLAGGKGFFADCLYW